MATARRKRQARFWSAILSRLLLGIVFGALGSLMVNCALVEISLSPLFAVAFGVLFLLSGGTIAWQVLLEPGGGESRVLLLGFAALVGTSGVLCFLLERDWSHGLSRSAKVPLYATLGVSLSFSTHFTALDLLGKLRGEPVYALLGGKTKERLPVYCTSSRPDLSQQLGFCGAKIPCPYGPADGDEGFRKNVAFLPL